MSETAMSRPDKPNDNPADTSGHQPQNRPVGARRRRATKPVIVGLALAGGGLLAAACGASASTHRAAPAPVPAPKPAVAVAAPTMVSTAPVGALGSVLVDSAGHTLYLFSADHQKTPTCATPSCVTHWPPLMAAGSAGAVAGPGVNASLLATVPAAGGGRQVTYNHFPLYTFAGDTAAGQANGQGVTAFGGTWSALTSAGQPAVTPTPAAPTIIPVPPVTHPTPAPVAMAPLTHPTLTPTPVITHPAPAPTMTPVTTRPAPPPTMPPHGSDGDGDNHGGSDDGDGGV